MYHNGKLINKEEKLCLTGSSYTGMRKEVSFPMKINVASFETYNLEIELDASGIDNVRIEHCLLNVSIQEKNMIAEAIISDMRVRDF